MTPTKGFSSDADYPLGLLFWIQLRAGLSPVCPRLVTLTTFFMIPVGDWSTSLAVKGRSKFYDNVIRITMSASEDSQRRREHALGCSCPPLVAYL
jgi:hypothetical protein